MEQATIEKIWENELKSGKKHWVLQINGERYSLWESELAASLAPGRTVEYDWEQSGRFRNIKKLQVLDEANPETGTFQDYQQIRDLRITRMGCLKYAASILSETELDSPERTDMALDIAKKFERYVMDEELKGK